MVEGKGLPAPLPSKDKKISRQDGDDISNKTFVIGFAL